MNPLRADFLLDPAVAFLNHGSYGAVPRPVLEAYQRWQMIVERQPVEFFYRRFHAAIDDARAALAAYVNAPLDTLMFLPNATVALNMVARTLSLRRGDEILTTDHEYGAMDIMWGHLTAQAGASYRAVALPDPIESAEQVVHAITSQFQPQTRALFLSHITSPTAITLPLEPIMRAARAHGILTIVDGAHTVGQIPLDMQALGADVYTSNCHKWLCAPRTAAFLYVRAEAQPLFEPLILSWGFLPENDFALQNAWLGTLDVAAYLSVPDAIAYQQANDWDQVRARCHALAQSARARLLDRFGTAPLTPDAPEWYQQMVAVELPRGGDYRALNQRLAHEHQVEVPITRRGERAYVRVSVQAYNDERDIDRLLDALALAL
ncbi:aminotransferase class V-fold PLP-dependent enzyme [Aggregatilineales bacterium SYSU G02658]